MNLRFNHYNVHPEVYKLMSTFEQWVSSSSLDKELYEIVKIRASQINGCSFCLDMHSTDFRKLGDNEQRVVLIGVWRESPCFSDRERAALELTEAVTEISKGGVSDALYNRVREHFSEKEYMELIMAINVINNWNRIAISTGMYPGYQNAK
ncbi:carboxymuconolactone decarboxylase family protein [Paenibacillus sp. HJGM_3]|uniref:carboxymuconolactone decarboxylase family protein n=1 Tax=Paenibacillus sp. HJGM_3 TaxID=3379816 RepID=UPI00385DBC02